MLLPTAAATNVPRGSWPRYDAREMSARAGPSSANRNPRSSNSWRVGSNTKTRRVVPSWTTRRAINGMLTIGRPSVAANCHRRVIGSSAPTTVATTASSGSTSARARARAHQPACSSRSSRTAAACAAKLIIGNRKHTIRAADVWTRFDRPRASQLMPLPMVGQANTRAMRSCSLRTAAAPNNHATIPRRLNEKRSPAGVGRTRSPHRPMPSKTSPRGPSSCTEMSNGWMASAAAGHVRNPKSRAPRATPSSTTAPAIITAGTGPGADRSSVVV